MSEHNAVSPRSLISLDGLVVARDGRLVLDAFSWATRRGEHWFILGANGCGKTTLLEIIAGYLWPREGRVHVLGHRYGRVNLADLRRRIGYVSPWIFNSMDRGMPLCRVVASGIDASVGFWGEMIPVLCRQVRNILKTLGIAEFYDQPFGCCSSGQQLRAILGRALINRPSVLLLDEPFAQLDISARLSMYSLFSCLVNRPRAPQIIMVTHHLEDIRPFFTHGMIMRAGKILHQGRRSAILSPATLKKAFG